LTHILKHEINFNVINAVGNILMTISIGHEFS